MIKNKAKEEPEIFEIFLDDKKITELEKKINELKENKEHVHFDDVRGNHILLVHKNTKIL